MHVIKLKQPVPLPKTKQSYAGDGDKNRHMHACMYVRAYVRIRTVVYRRAFFFALRAKMD
jgi:hypothetical protein